MILPSSVLFCCTMNEIRSPMAEGIMKRFHGTQVFVDSAGVRQGGLDPLMVEVMAEIGVDMTRHKPKVFDNLTDDSFDMARSQSRRRRDDAVYVLRRAFVEHCRSVTDRR
jgi:protein-tyrosine-phosphatase